MEKKKRERERSRHRFKTILGKLFFEKFESVGKIRTFRKKNDFENLFKKLFRKPTQTLFFADF